MEENQTQKKGKITELQVLTYFLNKGYVLSQPIIDMRYDFLLDYNDYIYKIQVKTSRLSQDGDYIEFNTSNSHTNTQGTINKNYKGV